MKPDWAAFLSHMDRALVRGCIEHLGWKKDDARPLFRRWVRRELEFTAKMFFNRRSEK